MKSVSLVGTGSGIDGQSNVKCRKHLRRAFVIVLCNTKLRVYSAVISLYSLSGPMVIMHGGLNKYRKDMDAKALGNTKQFILY